MAVPSHASKSAPEVFFGSELWFSSLLVRKGQASIGALIIGIGFWGPLYYNYNKQPRIAGFRVWGLRGFGSHTRTRQGFRGLEFRVTACFYDVTQFRYILWDSKRSVYIPIERMFASRRARTNVRSIDLGSAKP